MGSGNDALVDRVKKKGYIESERVENAFRNVDRKHFLPENRRDRAYEDRAVPIGRGQTISAPHMVAINTELLNPRSSDRVLEIGSGSGYQAALLAELSGKVVGVELEEELAERSEETLEELGIDNVEIRRGEGLKVVEEDFDRILFSCAVEREVFEEAKEYLEEDGVLVAPVKEDGRQVVKKFSDGEETDHGMVRFVDYREE